MIEREHRSLGKILDRVVFLAIKLRPLLLANRPKQLAEAELTFQDLFAIPADVADLLCRLEVLESFEGLPDVSCRLPLVHLLCELAALQRLFRLIRIDQLVFELLDLHQLIHSPLVLLLDVAKQLNFLQAELGLRVDVAR